MIKNAIKLCSIVFYDWLSKIIFFRLGSAVNTAEEEDQSLT